MKGKSLKQLQSEQTRRSAKAEKLTDDLKKEKAALVQLKKDIAEAKKAEAAAKKAAAAAKKATATAKKAKKPAAKKTVKKVK